MNIKPIHTEKDYLTSLQRIEKLFDSDLETNTQTQDELEVLTTLIESYEAKHYLMPPSNPVDALFFIMDQKDLNRRDMEQYLGSKSRVSEVLNGKINLSMKQVIKLHKGLGIPYESLISETMVA